LTRATGFQKAMVPTKIWNNLLQLEKWQYVSAKVDGRVGMKVGWNKINLELVTDPEGLQNNWPCLSWWPLHPRLLRCCFAQASRPYIYISHQQFNRHPKLGHLQEAEGAKPRCAESFEKPSKSGDYAAWAVQCAVRDQQHMPRCFFYVDENCLP
jgi:hypothetical protein